MLEQDELIRVLCGEKLADEGFIVQVGLDVFLRDRIAREAAQQHGMDIDTDIGAVHFIRGMDAVQYGAVQEDALADMQGKARLIYIEGNAAAGHEGELELLVPMPVDITQNIAAQLIFVNGKGEAEAAMLRPFTLLFIDVDIILLHFVPPVLNQYCDIFYYDILLRALSITDMGNKLEELFC